EFVFAGAHVVLPSVPGAAQDVSLEPAFAERSLQVEAMALRRVELVADPCERDVLLADPHAGQRARLDLVHARHRLESSFRHGPILALEPGLNGVSVALWRRSCWRGSTCSSEGSSKGCCPSITSPRPTASTRRTW